MGKKTNTKQSRIDVFYNRAKAAGFRARSAYKLIQLNRKFNFLENARVCIDLCAAPGSWMQVASKTMPASSIIIGVDRVDIAPIPNTISIKGDITTDKVRSDIKSQLKSWKADVVLHDGAPNVGQNWLHDAYQQNLLVLHSFKLACGFLKKGGFFVTKIFRSKDHLSLEYIFRKLFKSVETTKPVASRFESAETFIVCIGFLAPDKIDQQFFDAKHVFQSLEAEPTAKINILKPLKLKKKPEGYEEGITMLFKKNKISDFIISSDYINILEETSEFEWDLLAAAESSFTTPEILEITKDIKLLGRKELRMLIKWRQKVKDELDNLKQTHLKKEETIEKVEEVVEKKDEIEEELEELEEIQKEITKLQNTKQREEKQRLKKLEKKKRKIDEKLKLRLMVPGDPGPTEGKVHDLFSIDVLDRVSTLNKMVDLSADVYVEPETVDKEEKLKYKYVKRGDEEIMLPKSDDEMSDSEDSDAEGLNLNGIDRRPIKIDRENFDDDEGKNNPLTTDLVGDIVKDKKERKAEQWFADDIFDTLEEEDLEEYELDTAVAMHQKAGGKIRTKVVKESTEASVETPVDAPQELPRGTKRKVEEVSDAPQELPRGTKRKVEEVSDAPQELPRGTKRKVEEVSDAPNDEEEKSPSDDDSSSEEEPEPDAEAKEQERLKKLKAKNAPKLDIVGKALATKMLKSKKTKRDIMDDSWNRYMCGDEDLPDFFVQYQERFNTPAIQVDSEDLKLYQEKSKSVDARTIKKVVEAKARKQRKLKKRLSRARKKAEVVANNYDMSNSEKAMEMKKIYKKASSILKPKETKYVVMKKHFGGTRPKGGKGPSKMVDKRLKKDKRSVAAKDKKKKKR